jgi:hypothetical protein
LFFLFLLAVDRGGSDMDRPMNPPVSPASLNLDRPMKQPLCESAQEAEGLEVVVL